MQDLTEILEKIRHQLKCGVTVITAVTPSFYIGLIYPELQYRTELFRHIKTGCQYRDIDILFLE